MASVPPPAYDGLLPQLLAHLPGAHTTSQPPASLYPFLSPILRQRLRVLSSPSQDEPWPLLLTWSPAAASDLVSHLSTLDLTPHPSSGEIESGELRPRGYKRLDPETLWAATELLDWGLDVTLTWITGDADGEPDGWKISELQVAGATDEAEWSRTIDEAERAFAASSAASTATAAHAMTAAVEKEEDDDYWNMYDRSAAPTPGGPQKDAPSEEDYFSRYFGEQTDDATAPEPNVRSSDHQMDGRFSNAQTSGNRSSFSAIPSSPPKVFSDTATAPSTPSTAVSATFPDEPHMPLPGYSPLLSVAKFEEAASRISSEVAVKQHISTSLKSLYRLSKASGIDREEFSAIIQTELALLSMQDEDD